VDPFPLRAFLQGVFRCLPFPVLWSRGLTTNLFPPFPQDSFPGGRSIPPSRRALPFSICFLPSWVLKVPHEELSHSSVCISRSSALFTFLSPPFTPPETFPFSSAAKGPPPVFFFFCNPGPSSKFYLVPSPLHPSAAGLAKSGWNANFPFSFVHLF